jgi:hypothetical protein
MPLPANNRGAKGLKRAGDKQYGRGRLSNGWYFSAAIPFNSRRGRRVRSLMDDYIEASGDASALALDFYRSAALTQWEIDQLEAAPELNINKHRLLIGQRERLLRQAGVIANPSHHDVPALPGAPEDDEDAPVETQAAQNLANLFAAAETADTRRMASLLAAPKDGEPNND